MLDSKVMLENRRNVSRQLMTISGAGITLLYGLSFILWWQGYLSISLSNLILAAFLSYALYGLSCALYLVPGLRAWYHFVFPLEMYVTVAIGIAAYGAPIAAFAAWLFPVIYAGMYAKRGAMLLTSILVLITAPVLSYWVHQDQWSTVLQDVLIAIVVLLVVILRMLSMVNRSRAVLMQTVEEVEKNQELEKDNQLLIQEVAVTAQEISRVVDTLVEAAAHIREAMSQITRGADEMTAASQESLQLLITNQQGVEQQANRSVQIGQAIIQAVRHGEETRIQAMTGEQIVLHMGEVMQTIERMSNDSTQLVGNLSKRTNEIEEMNNTIAGIAKHITVVAINASIEAARAGAAGRTFTIVANQVQELARQTAEAVKEIGELARNIRCDLERVTSNMGESAQIVDTGVRVADEARGKLLGISQASLQIHTLLEQIMGHTQRQQQEADEVARGIARLRQKTDGNVAHIEETAASTEETSAVMEEFTQHVDRLRERSDVLQQILQRLRKSTER